MTAVWGEYYARVRLKLNFQTPVTELQKQIIFKTCIDWLCFQADAKSVLSIGTASDSIFVFINIE